MLICLFAVTNETAWPSGQRVRLTVQRFRCDHNSALFHGGPEFKFSATLVNSQLVWLFFIFYCYLVPIFLSILRLSYLTLACGFVVVVLSENLWFLVFLQLLPLAVWKWSQFTFLYSNHISNKGCRLNSTSCCHSLIRYSR